MFTPANSLLRRCIQLSLCHARAAQHCLAQWPSAQHLDLPTSLSELFLRVTEHINIQLTEFLMMEMPQDIVSCYPVNSSVAGSSYEEIYVWWDNGQIMKVIDLKKQPKN